MLLSQTSREPALEGVEMDGEVPWAQLESLHCESFGWARSCCRQDAEEAENVSGAAARGGGDRAALALARADGLAAACAG
jgi:hypothetical protein